jgi:hypothetical protein
MPVIVTVGIVAVVPERVAVALYTAVAGSRVVVEAYGRRLFACCTNAVVAICVVFVPAGAVGAVGVPVKAGEHFPIPRRPQ